MDIYVACRSRGRPSYQRAAQRQRMLPWGVSYNEQLGPPTAPPWGAPASSTSRSSMTRLVFKKWAIPVKIIWERWNATHDRPPNHCSKWSVPWDTSPKKFWSPFLPDIFYWNSHKSYQLDDCAIIFTHGHFNPVMIGHLVLCGNLL